MSSLNLSVYSTKVVSTYPTPVTCTVWYKSPTGAPTPGPLTPIPPNSIQIVGMGDVAYIVVSYNGPSGPQTATIQYGAPIDMTRPINALWATGPTEQIIVLVETDVVDPGPQG